MFNSLQLVPLQFFSNDFGIKRSGAGGGVGEDEDARLGGGEREQRQENFQSGPTRYLPMGAASFIVEIMKATKMLNLVLDLKQQFF